MCIKFCQKDVSDQWRSEEDIVQEYISHVLTGEQNDMKIADGKCMDDWKILQPSTSSS